VVIRLGTGQMLALLNRALLAPAGFPEMRNTFPDLVKTAGPANAKQGAGC
jgi:hypothetical protein